MSQKTLRQVPDLTAQELAALRQGLKVLELTLDALPWSPSQFQRIDEVRALKTEKLVMGENFDPEQIVLEALTTAEYDLLLAGARAHFRAIDALQTVPSMSQFAFPDLAEARDIALSASDKVSVAAHVEISR